MNKRKLFLVFLTTLVLPISVLAQVVAVPTIGGIAQAIAGQVVIVATWIVVIMWIVCGVLFLTAQGEPAKLNAAKMALFSAIGGTILIILANSAVIFVKNSFGI